MTPATEVDHITPKAEGGTDDRSNLQGLCTDCHKAKTKADQAQKAALYPKWLPKPSCPVTLICGAPGSGKTTEAHRLAGPNDTVIDLDEIRAELAGVVQLYGTERASLNEGIRERNRRLADLHRKITGQAFVVMSAPKRWQREWWQARLNATIVLLPTTYGECLERIRQDERRAGSVAAHERRATTWWKDHNTDIGEWPTWAKGMRA